LRRAASNAASASAVAFEPNSTCSESNKRYQRLL
jgi:hypothetical protein